MTEETKRKSPLKVFLCHASEDKQAVNRLHGRLRSTGVDAWLDETKLLPGQDWDQEIQEAIEVSDVIIICLSKTSVSKEGYVQREIKAALEKAKEKPPGTIFIIPARLNKCEVPKFLHQLQVVDLFAADGFNKLLLSLQVRADKSGKRAPVIQPTKQTTNKYMGIAFILAIAGLFIWGASYFLREEPAVVDQPTPSPAFDELPLQILDEHQTAMVLVKPGPFKMGTEEGKSDEKPVHVVELSGYYIDKYEATNQLYKLCVNDGVCDPPKEDISSLHNYFSKVEYSNYPVLYVDWFMSKKFCEWRGARLPTEAEWEKAARGGEERTYPWGEKISCAQANYDFCAQGPVQVGSYPEGMSAYGAYDMAGNVWEWVSDWYRETYYSELPLYVQDPVGPGVNRYVVSRGGGWGSSEFSVRSTSRGIQLPSSFSYDVGIRCARSISDDFPYDLVMTPSALTQISLTSDAPAQIVNPLIATSSALPFTPTVACNAAEFIQDISVPDGTVYSPNAAFTKIWRLKNSGSCTWLPDYKIILTSGLAMGHDISQPLNYIVEPGKTVDVSLDLIAPENPGVFISHWSLCDSNNVCFESFYLKITVQ